MTVYRGIRDEKTGECRVYVDNEPLPLRRDVVPCARHFAWGNLSQGAQQLSVALLAHSSGDMNALRFYYRFCERWVRGLKQVGEWAITADGIKDQLRRMETRNYNP